jgi:hypothetical protein
MEDPFISGYMQAVKQVIDFANVVLPSESVHSLVTTLIDQTCSRLEELIQVVLKYDCKFQRLRSTQIRL